jgi:outer membrane murein-binding lipoprotein Lpp
MVSPSVGLVKMAVDVMSLVLASTVVSGRSRNWKMASWNTNAATVAAIHAIAEMIRTLRSSSRAPPEEGGHGQTAVG